MAGFFADPNCTCTPPSQDDGGGMCSWCQDAPLRELEEAHAEGDPPTLEELEDHDVEI